MKRYLYLFPVLALTAASFTLTACDDKKTSEEQAQAGQETTAVPAETAPASPPVAAEPSILLQEAGTPATAPGATTAAVFLTVVNKQSAPDKLLAAKTDLPGTTAEIHETSVDPATSVMQMRKVDSLEIPATGQVMMNPTASHIMLLGLTAPLVEGITFNLTLTFEKGGEVTIPVSVKGQAAADDASVPTGDATSTNPVPMTDHTGMALETTPAPETTGQPDAAGSVAPVPVQTPESTPATEAAPAPAAPTTEAAPATNEQQPVE